MAVFVPKWLNGWSLQLVLFTFMFGMMLQHPVAQNMILRKVCLQEHEEDICQDMSRDPAIQDQVQSKASGFITLQLISMGIPSAIASLLLGAASDKYGRKRIMLITCSGIIFLMLSFLYQASIDGLSKFVICLGGIVTGATGGIMVFIGTVTNYITDTTPEDQRTKKLSQILPFMGLGAVSGVLSAGYLENNYGYQTVFGISASCEILTFLVILLAIKDVKLNQKETGQGILSKMTAGINVIMEDKPPGNRRQLLVLLLNGCLGMSFAMSEGSILLMYTKRPPFEWDSTVFGLFAASKQIAGVLGQAVGTGVLTRIMGSSSVRSDFTLLQLGALSSSIICLITAAATSPLMLLSVILFCFLSGPMQSAGGSLSSRLVPSEKKGSHTAFSSFIAMFMAPIGSYIYNSVYSSSVAVGKPALVFVFLAGTHMVAFLALTFGKAAASKDDDEKTKTKST